MKFLKTIWILPIFFFAHTLTVTESAESLPSNYTALNDYVIDAPNQGDTDACLFVASTGAMEILLNKKAGNHHPRIDGATDLSERYTIHADESELRSKHWFENAFLKFDSGEAALAKDLPFEGYTEDGDLDYSGWNSPGDFDEVPKIKLPKIDTTFLFSVGDEYSRGVLDASHVDIVKHALVEYESPVIAIGNDDDSWHAVVITGYDDEATDGKCYELPRSVCAGKKGAFYVRDSFGNGIEKRSYEWFIRRQNSATVARLADE